MPARCSARAVVLATIVSIALHLAGIGCMLPAHPQQDEKVLWLQLQVARDRPVTPDERLLSHCYPDLIGHVSNLCVPEPPPRIAGDLGSLARRASHDLVWIRAIVALFAGLLVPGTYLVARRFLDPRWSLAAAGLVSSSTLVSWYGSMARPHVVVAALVTCTVAAALRARERGRIRDFAWAGVCGALAVGALQSGACGGAAIFAAWALCGRPRLGRPLVGLLLAATLMCAAVPLFLHSDPLPAAGQGRGGVWNLLLSWFGMGVHDVDQSFFDGEGFLRAWFVARDHEPVLALGALLGLAALLLRALRCERFEGGRWRSAVVVAAHALPHALLFGWYSGSFQRMWLPLATATVVLALVGARACLDAAGTRSRGAVAAVLLVLVLAQTLVALNLARLRVRDSSFDLAARWIEAHPECEPVYLGQTIDVALVPEDPQFRAWLASSRLYFLPWQTACLELSPEERARLGHDLHNVPLEDELKRRQLAEDPAAYVRDLGQGTVLIERVPAHWRPTFRVLRAALEPRARRLASIEVRRWNHLGAGPVKLFDGPLADERWFWWRVLTVDRLGPPIDVYGLDEPRSR